MEEDGMIVKGLEWKYCPECGPGPVVFGGLAVDSAWDEDGVFYRINVRVVPVQCARCQKELEYVEIEPI